MLGELYKPRGLALETAQTKKCCICGTEFLVSKFTPRRILCGSEQCRYQRRKMVKGATLIAYQKEWAEKNKTRLREYKRDYYLRNRERRAEYLRENRQRILQGYKNRCRSIKENYLNGGWKNDEIRLDAVDKHGYVWVYVGKYHTFRHIVNWARANGRLPIKGRHIHHKDGRLIFDTRLQCLTKNDDPSNLEERPNDDPWQQHDIVYIRKLENENAILKKKIIELEAK